MAPGLLFITLYYIFDFIVLFTLPTDLHSLGTFSVQVCSLGKTIKSDNVEKVNYFILWNGNGGW